MRITVQNFYDDMKAKGLENSPINIYNTNSCNSVTIDSIEVEQKAWGKLIILYPKD